MENINYIRTLGKMVSSLTDDEIMNVLSVFDCKTDKDICDDLEEVFESVISFRVEV